MPAKILIVDDERPVRMLLEKILSRSGYRCKSAAGASEARRQLNREAFDLILTDVMMPGETGIDLIRFAAEAYPDTGIIMVTAVENPEEVKIAIESDIYGYVVKPFSQSQILICVANALRHRKLDIQKNIHKKNLEEVVEQRTAEYRETIRELKQVQQELLLSEERFRNLIEGSIQGILIHRGHKPIFVNQMWANIHGYTVEEILEMESVVPLISIQDQARMVGYRKARLRKENVPIDYEYQGVRKNGSLVWLENRVRVVDWDGQPAIQTTIHDISSRKKSEEGLRESQEKFRAISSSAIDAIIMIDAGGKITFWNQSAERIFGFSAAEVFGRHLHRLLAPDRFHEAHRSGFRKFLTSGKGSAIGKTLELFAKRKTGGEFPVELSLSGVHVKNEWHAIGIVRDITDRKEAEDRLKKAHKETDRLIRSINSILIEIGSDGCVYRWNDTAEKTFGLTATDVVGKSLPSGKDSVDWDSLKKDISECTEKRRSIRLDDISYRRPDGRSGYLGITLNPIIREENQVPGILIMGADITERKHLESQLSQAQKLESIGQLAAGIAHEINTPIQYVGDNTRFLEGAFNDIIGVLKSLRPLIAAEKEGAVTEEKVREAEAAVEAADLDYLMEEIPEAVRQSLDGVDRVAKIVRSMKEFSHPGGNEKTGLDVNRALESTITVARNEWKYVANMETDFDPALPLVPCLPGELNQVFLNMIINAAHAISDVVGDGATGKGTIRIRTALRGETAEVRIGDTGAGIPKEIRNRIFDPFFTTKEVGKGTGQGLAISHAAIVEKHGGELTFETETGKGTTFVIRLPLQASSQAQEAA